jgi:methyltransferase family protein
VVAATDLDETHRDHHRGWKAGDALRAVNAQAPDEINRGYLAHFRRWSGSRAGAPVSSFGWRLVYGRLARVLTLPFLPFVTLFVLVRVKLLLAFAKRFTASDLHERALDHVDEFVEQYPLHLYPIVAKALELAYLKDSLSRVLTKDSKVLEVAIGDGTLSKHVFGAGRQITGVDLSPYSLSKAVPMPHVRRAVVGDGLNPPFRLGAFDLLLSNNFLHHVTQKTSTLANWSRLATLLLFNENTPYWASGWTIPYLLRRVGLERMAARSARTYERHSLQALEPAGALTTYAEQAGQVLERTSFLSERTFFYCSLFSFSLRCTGPPTPSSWKALALGPLRAIVLPLTRTLARLLIRFDACQDRSTDTFVVFLCRTSQRRDSADDDLRCAVCGAALGPGLHCLSCGEHYPSKDGMVFLLPRELQHVFQDYRSEAGAAISAEHL